MAEPPSISLEAAYLSLASGSCASALSTALLSRRSAVDKANKAGGLNGPSQRVWGVDAARTKQASFKHTALGFLIHHGTSVFWATLYERLGTERKQATPLEVVTAAADTAVAPYIVDYHLTPRRFQHGYEKHMTGRSMTFVYLAFAVGLAAVTLTRKRRATSWSSAQDCIAAASRTETTHALSLFTIALAARLLPAR